MEFRILGSLAAVHEGRPLDLGTPRMRAMLALLLLRPGQVVPVSQIIDELWPEGTSADARSVVHAYASRLRRALSQSGLLLTRTPGYLLQIEPDQVDLHRFDEVLARAREATDAHRRVELFGQALAMWRGPALVDLPATPALAAEAVRLAEHRLTALEESFDARLAAGQSGELVGELTALVAENPLRERPHALLMHALYRAGRQAEALDVYTRLRRRLAGELGIDPGPELRTLHQQVLAADPVLVQSPAARTPVPRQLPAPVGQFVGRADELKALTRLLETAAERPSMVVISAIGGGGGIGKTWFAVHWAHEHLERFPDGQLYVDLRGYDPAGEPMTTATAVRGFLDALGVDPSTVPVDLAAQAALYRSTVADRRMLIVLDNARDTAHVVPLLPGTPSCTVLVTSRHRLGGLITAHRAVPLALDVLSDNEARELLRHHLGHERVVAESDAVAELVAHCAGLPLALSIVTARAATHPDFRLADLAEELRDASSRLDGLDAGELSASLRAVFACSYEALDADSARAFGLLGLFPGPDIDLNAAAALLGLPAGRAQALLRNLEASCLIQQPAPRRYQMHDLLQLYAAEQAPESTEALRRLVDFYLGTANAADHVLDPHRPVLVDLAATVELADQDAALAWFGAEHSCLIAAQQLAVRQGWHAQVWQLAWVTGTFHRRHHHPHDDYALWQAGAAAADVIGDPAVQARAQRRLGFASLGVELPANQYFEQALAHAERAGDRLDQAHTYFNLAVAWERQDNPERALASARDALELFRSMENLVGEADALNAVGYFYGRVGRYEEARESCEASLALCRQLAHQQGEAEALDSLGYIAHQAGRFEDSFARYRESLVLLRDLGSASGQANTLVNLGEAYADAGRVADARDTWEQAIGVYEEQRRHADVDRIRRRIEELDG